MSTKWIKSHITLLAGISLPILLMLVFVISNIPFFKTAPPQYNLLFSVTDSSSGSMPFQVNFVVKNDKLVAQYTKVRTTSYWGLKKLYFFDAKTQKVQELPLDQPSFNKNSDYRELVVKSTEQYKLDTNLESPDGYILYTANNNINTGFLSALLLGSNYRGNDVCLKKNATCISLFNLGDGRYFYSNNVQFIGWVKP